jgi:hypothetical protein
METLLLTDSIRFAHVLAVSVGLGASILADMTVLARLRRPISDDLLIVLHRVHRIVWLALLAMWISGIGLIYLKTGLVWAEFTPKLCAKVVTVSLLTVNAMLIGRAVMPRLAAARGRSFVDLSRRDRAAFALAGGVSSASWLLALAMGISKVLAASPAQVFVGLMPVAYLGAVLAVWVMLSLRPLRSVWQAG